MAHAYRFGIEEEFFLADARTRGTPRAGLRAFHAAVRARLDDAEREQLQCQVEVASPPTADLAEARAHLAGLRASLAEIGGERGILTFAAGTHPTARWRDQRPTDKARYHGIMADLRMLGRRNLVCGLHVHVEVPDPAARIGLINRLLPYLPVLLALSTGSPFWQSEDLRQFPGGLTRTAMDHRLSWRRRASRCGLTRTLIDWPCLSPDLSAAREHPAVRFCLADACDPRRA